MKNVFPLILLTVIGLVLSSKVSAQGDVAKIKFEYDLNGNRISRTIIFYKSDLNKTGDENQEGFNQIEQESDKYTEKLGEHNINIYPNPTVGKIVIETKSPVDNLIIELTDIKGKSLEKFTNTQDNKFTLDLSNNTNGIYLLKLCSDGDCRVWKIIKQ